MSRLLLVLLFTFVFASFANSEERECKSDFCTLVRVKCAVTESCGENQELRIYPELCRCCPRCYDIKEKGQPCSPRNNTLCQEGLNCVDETCT